MAIQLYGKMNKLYDLGYCNFEEYLVDLLNILDLKIEKYLVKKKLREIRISNPLKGMVVSEEEVLKILSKEDSTSEDESKIRNLSSKIDMIAKEINGNIKIAIEKGLIFNFNRLSNLFNLDDIEMNLLIVGISVELDTKYEKVFGFLHDNINNKRPTFDVAFNILEIPFEEKIKFRNNIRKGSFFQKFILKQELFLDESTFLSSELIIDERIVDFIINGNNLDVQIKELISEYIPVMDDKNLSYKLKVVEDIDRTINNFYINAYGEKCIYIFLHGDKGVGKKSIIKNYVDLNCVKLIIADLKILSLREVPLRESIKKILREAVLREAFVCFENYSCIEKDLEDRDILLKDFFISLEFFNQPVFVLSEEKYKPNKYFNESAIVSFNVERPVYEERIELWEYYLKSNNLDGFSSSELAAKFNFTPLQINNAAKSTSSKLLLDNENRKVIYEACYEQVDSKLTEKTVKVKATYTWEQLVLPEEQKKYLKDACNQVKNRYTVYEKWGFGKKLAYGKGLSLICAGPPGTGKTMSAQVVANELNLELYRIDLSQIVSKYIGETEKNLDMIFNEAKLSNAILFFDEADSLFGKRSEVKSANDKYANMETAYLLQKIEEYEGISMLATNYLNNIDKAFLRRINYVITYPFPNAMSRKQIWIGMFPVEAPLDEDVDFDYLSKTFEIAGGNIKNVVVYSAFIAAEEKKCISMRHILYAAKYELQKMDKLLLVEDLGEYKYLLR